MGFGEHPDHTGARQCHLLSKGFSQTIVCENCHLYRQAQRRPAALYAYGLTCDFSVFLRRPHVASPDFAYGAPA